MDARKEPNNGEGQRPGSPWLKPGHNCWRVCHAERLAFLIDGASYFEAFYRAALRAERSILILSWDIDTRIRLVKDHSDDSGFPVELGEFLRHLLRRKRRLRIHILNWDFAMIYALERQWMPMVQFGWRPHRRLRFHLNDRHPTGASQHEKLVVIDDTVAFIGGMDLTKNRWDTPAHRSDDEWRVDPDGRRYPPFHDVHAMVCGEVASSLGDLARMRWKDATGRDLPPSSGPGGTETWPSAVRPDLTDVTVGIARTQPRFDGRPEVREVERAYIGAIDAAQRYVFLESQYFTSHAVGQALERRLSSERSPEIVLVTRQDSDGWLEHHTMDVLRSRLVKRLRRSSRQGRFRVYCPTVPNLPEGECIGVHSKLLIVDDAIVTIGSANLSNRSMGLDSECNLVIDGAGHARIRDGIRAFRHRLLGEHVGTAPQEVANCESRSGSLIATIEQLKGGDRNLRDCSCEIDPEVDQVIPEAALIDPERPVDPDRLWSMLFRSVGHRHAGREMITAVSIFLALCALAAAWRWTPLGEWITVPTLLEALRSLRAWPDGFAIVFAGYLLGGFLAVPVTILIAVTVIALGPFLGFVAALGGSTASAVLTFLVGRWVGRPVARRLAGARVKELTRRLARRGVLAVVTIRMLPIAPFSIVNLVAGASGIRLVDFAVGTILGMSPGILVAVLLVDRVAEAIQSPNPTAFAILGLLIACAWLGAMYVVRRLKRTSGSETSQEPKARPILSEGGRG